MILDLLLFLVVVVVVFHIVYYFQMDCFEAVFSFASLMHFV